VTAMQVWTPEKLKSAARLYRLGLAPEAISAEIDVPLSRVVWLIGYRKDLFDAKAKPEPVKRESAFKPSRASAPKPVTIGRSLQALTYTPRRQTAFEAGIDSLLPAARAPVGQPVSLLQATSLHCKWVLPRADRSAPMLFCGNASLPGQSWCACHADHVWQKGEA